MIFLSHFLKEKQNQNGQSRIKQKRRKGKNRNREKQKKIRQKMCTKKRVVYYSCMILDLECDLYTQQTDVTFPTGINCK